MINQENWYKTFFTGLALEMWDNALPPAFTDGEVKFIREVAPIAVGANVLDIPCGSGRLSIPLARQGFLVTGIDISEGNINTLNKLKEGLDIQSICADILEYPLKGSFDLAICMGNSFSYFPYEKMVVFASKVRQALKPGAKFVINTGSVAESILRNLKDNMEMNVSDMLFKIENSYEVDSSVLRTVMQFVKRDATETKISYHFVFTLAEIRRILKTAGFSTAEVYSDTEKAAYKLGSHQAYIVAS